MAISTEALEEAKALKELFGAGAAEAVHRRIAMAIDRGRFDDAMFWLDVQSLIYSTAYE